MKVVQFEVEIKGITGTIDDVDSLKAAIKATNKELGGTKFGTEEYKRLQTQLGSLKTVQKQVTDETRRQQREFQRVNSASGSYRQINAELVQLRGRFKELSEDQRETFGPALLQRIGELDTELKKLDKTLGNHQRNVGNYEGAISMLGTTLESIESDLKDSRFAVGGLLDGLDDVGGVTGRASGAVSGLGKSFSALASNPIVLAISLVVAGISSLFKAFQRTEKGAQVFARVTGTLNGIFSTFVGFVDRATDSLLSFAADPLEGVKDLGPAILKNIINRVKASIDIFGIAGRAIGKFFTGDLKGATAAAREAGGAFIQLTTGLDSEQQQEFAESIANTTKAVSENITAFSNLEAARRAIFRQNLELQKSIEGRTTREAELNVIADDATKSFEEREKAAEGARRSLEERAAAEVKLARNNLSLINQEIGLRRRNGENIDSLLEQQLIAFSALASAERDLTISVRENEKVRSELKQDRLERDLDILIDGLDNQKTINERIIADESRTLEERQRLLEKTEQQAIDSFQKQISTIQQFTGVQVEANELLAESDAVRLNQRIRELGLSEIIEGRLLEVIRERRTAIQDLAETEKDLDNQREQQNNEGLLLGRIAALSDLELSEAEYNRKRKEIELQTEIEILQNRLAQNDLNKIDRLRVEQELADAVKELARQTLEARLQSEIEAIEESKFQQIAALRELDLSEEQFQERRKQLEQEANTQILRNRLANQELSNVERLRLEDELNTQLTAKDQLRVAAQVEYRNRLLQGVSNAANILNSILETTEQNAASLDEQRIGDIEARYNREIELADGNTERIAELEARKDAEIERVQRAAFERGKRLQVSQALISGAQSIISVLAAIPGPLDLLSLGLARTAQIALTAFTTGVQIAAIRRQQFAEKGINIQPLRLNAVQSGRLHSQGGNHTSVYGQPLEYERGEFATMDEFGGVAVINRKSTGRFGNILKRIGPKNYAGKRRDLSLINSFGGNGIAFGREGISISPNLRGITVSQSSLSINTDDLRDMIVQAVREGSYFGTKEGSKEGTRQGAVSGTRQGVSEGLISATREQERIDRLEEQIR
ncbi:hypothetical protein [Gilvibacter sp.]|uniref:hypothetical protein n=1 Tax=Gilvibacter sp. TaxID=2729997 RepID=UPI0025C54A01|nr:hypothetical protein [Gilvibacter sp.]NQX78632.1 hypothetical protein [Gilvibacter sp.]